MPVKHQSHTKLPTALALLYCAVALSLQPGIVHAEIKTILADAEYVMGDGETSIFAEEMVLQKAKRIALEEAGTYVRSYTKVQDLDLTVDELETLAGGVLSVVVQDRRRFLDANGTRFSIKIQATVDTQNVDQLAGRIQRSDGVKEYVNLQAQYRNLIEEVEQLKKQPVRTEHGFERQLALDRIREIETAFAAAQKNERSFFERFVSGEQLYVRAEIQLAEQQALKRRRENALDEFLEAVEHDGHVIHIGEPEVKIDPDVPTLAQVNFSVSVEPSGRIGAALKRLREAYSNDLSFIAWKRIHDFLDRLTFVLQATARDGEVIGCYATRYSVYEIPNSTEILAIEDGPHSLDAYVKIASKSLKMLAGVRGFFSSKTHVSCQE